MTLQKARFYADENIEDYLIAYIRNQGYHVDSARELGFSSRDDLFQFQEAKRRKCLLITKDTDFLDHKRFPFHNLNNTAIVILRTEDKPHSQLNFGYMLVCFFDEVCKSGNQNLFGLKIEIRGPKMIFHARIRSKIKHDMVDISKGLENRPLFND